jgi:hypothetical protein
LLLAEIDLNLLFLAGAALVAVMLMRWKRRNPASERSASPDPRAAARVGAALPASLDQWEVRMHDLARDLSGQLDTKIRIVQELLLRAEAQTARLEAAIERLDSSREKPLGPDDSPSK